MAVLSRAVSVNMSTNKKKIAVGMSTQNKNLGVGVYLPAGTITYYEVLKNKPSIESVTLVGDKTFEQLCLSSISADDLLEILI